MSARGSGRRSSGMWTGTMIRRIGMSRPAQAKKPGPKRLHIKGKQIRTRPKEENAQEEEPRQADPGRHGGPADIKYPTDIDLLNRSREHQETAVDLLWPHVPHTRHKLPYSAKNARKSYLKLAKSKKWTKTNCRKAIGEQLNYIELATRQLEKYEALVPDANILFPRWLRDRLAVIPVMYRQQKMMYNNDTHICKDRIVSLEQPHMRPIQRGKRPDPTKFGQKLHLSVVDGYTYLEQTSWSNFNESCDLEAAVKDYFRKFSCYPSAVLVNRIYQTCRNKMFCTRPGIRLSGPPLGRREASETDTKIKRQIYRDVCECSAIEGQNGNAKRRFGLDRLFSKLDETAKAEVALVILAMNASLRLVRWLALFFRFLLSLYVGFQQALN